LIETFRKLFNTKNYGHQGSILGGLLLFIRVSSKQLKQATSDHQNNARGLLVNISSFLLNAISLAKPFLNIKTTSNHRRVSGCIIDLECRHIMERVKLLKP
jgi:hypothetical protein